MKSIKNLFNTPKKAVMTSVCALGLIAVLGTGTVFAAMKASDSSNIQKQKEDKDRSEAELIGMESAKEIALEDAGVKAEAVTFTKEETENEDGIVIYELEFYSDDYEYEYEINATNGKLISHSKETLFQSEDSGQKDSQSTDRNEETAQSEYIGIKAAKEKALEDAGVSAGAATFTKAKLDQDDGIAVYDIEFFTSKYEYEYEINAKTGSIRERDKEALETDGKTGGNGQGEPTYIGTEKAKSIALQHAGLSSDEVSFTKVKREEDDGQVVYEIEFGKDRKEYEYTIHAVSGDIVDFESDWDD